MIKNCKTDPSIPHTQIFSLSADKGEKVLAMHAISASGQELPSYVKYVIPIVDCVQKDIDEHVMFDEFQMFHVLSQSYAKSKVFTVPKIAPEEVKKPTGCLLAMSETPKGQHLFTIWDIRAVVCVAPVSSMT